MAKPIIFGIFFFVIVAIIYGVNYSTQIDEAQRDLVEAKRELTNLEGSIVKQSEVTTQRKELAALIQASDILLKKNNVVRDEIRALEKSEGRIAEAFIRAIERVRNETVGLTMDEMPLPGGRVLRRVRIQAVDQSELTVLHSEGVSKVAMEDLPEDLKERLRIGIPVPGGKSAAAYRSSSDASDRMVALGRTAPDEKKKPAKSSGNISVEGDPGLWNSVTRQSLGRALVPGQGWLEIGTKGPIPGTAK